MTYGVGLPWRIRLAMCVLLGAIATSVRAGFEVDDFEGEANGAFNNPVFRHNIGPDEFFGYEPAFGEFANYASVSPRHSLALSPGTDYIRFDLAEDEFVDYASVWMRDFHGRSPAFFHVIGLDEAGQTLEYTVTTPEGDSAWFFVDTSAIPFAEITEIRLTGFTVALFDDLGVHIVPEPATLAFVGVGFAGLAWSKRRMARRIARKADKPHTD